MRKDKVGPATRWIAGVGSAVIALAMVIGFVSDSFTDSFTLNFLVPVILLNPLIFAVGSGIAFWRTGWLGDALVVFGAYLLTFALVWQIATNWYGFSWDNVGAGFVSIGLAALAYLVVSALVVLVLVFIQRARRSAP